MAKPRTDEPVADSDSAVATLSMHVGTDSVRHTDFQGREDSIPADANQDISVELSPMPVILEGLDLAASVRPAIDGDLGEWNFAESPIPLLCENQLSAPDSYRWSPESLSAVAKLAWDDEALYMAVLVRDDRHVAEETGEDTLRSDALEIGFHPGNRTPGSDGLAFEWLVGAASPGGGSGRHTLYRPPARNGGLSSGHLSSGHLAKDSSLYECAIRREGALTSYELRIPWGETGLSPAVGARAGLSLRVVDVDDPGAAAAAMAWGGGLAPVWAPSDFGVLTLLP